jgi:hypothetical protein
MIGNQIQRQKQISALVLLSLCGFLQTSCNDKKSNSSKGPAASFVEQPQVINNNGSSQGTASSADAQRAVGNSGNNGSGSTNSDPKVDHSKDDAKDPTNSQDPNNSPSQNTGNSSSGTPKTGYASLLGFLDTREGESDYLLRFSVAAVESDHEVSLVEAFGEGQFIGNAAGICECGKTTELNLIWNSKGQKGTLETLKRGEFIVSRTPSEDWKDDSFFEDLALGQHAIYAGADSDDDDECGVFSCESDHEWHNRDDIKLGLQCNLAECPVSTINSTALKVRYDISHEDRDSD